MTMVFDFGQFVFGFIAVVIAFIAGLMCGKDSRTFKVDRKEYDERWIGEPPPCRAFGGDWDALKKRMPPTVVTHLHAPWKK